MISLRWRSVRPATRQSSPQAAACAPHVCVPLKADVAANLGSRDLSVITVAKRQGITPRYLHMLFEAEGTSFSQFVLEQRLASAHDMLADWRFDHLTITAVAYAAGFGDLSYFNHSFRGRYGATPREVRKEQLDLRSS